MPLGNNILITGGSGTLGNAIVRAAEAQHLDCTFTIYSRSEYLQARMRQRYPRLRYILGDVADYDRLSAAIAGHDLVIHAAAMKRIPECETNPVACYTTNVLGSANVARACIAHGVKRCVAISTDKACKAITTYGASKLQMESIFRAQPYEPTLFSLVRYGNVVASRGSVVPIWRQQAKEGKPLTITDRACTRFWMAESDAVNLIDWALNFLSEPGQIAVPKMGALSLVEMAEIVAPGCELIETGLRSCEKIHEDLVHPEELAIDTGAWWNHFVLSSHYPWHDQPPTLGHCYTSDTAPRLSKEAFTAMLAEAEAHE